MSSFIAPALAGPTYVRAAVHVATPASTAASAPASTSGARAWSPPRPSLVAYQARLSWGHDPESVTAEMRDAGYSTQDIEIVFQGWRQELHNRARRSGWMRLLWGSAAMALGVGALLAYPVAEHGVDALAHGMTAPGAALVFFGALAWGSGLTKLLGVPRA